jgi:drug/metabolite transporter (DMT)-like permease
MFTVVSSLFILMAFGQRFEKKIFVYAFLIFLGVVLVNLSEGLNADTQNQAPLFDILVYGALPALIAAFSYPLGNQLVWQASSNAKLSSAFYADMAAEELLVDTGTGTGAHNNAKTHPVTDSRVTRYLTAKIPSFDTLLLQSSFNKIWLMTLGSLPFWLILAVIIQPPLPAASQVFNTFLVALLAGVVATGLFLYAREEAKTSSEVAGVDATQASEVIFALIGGMFLLNNALPSALGLVGVAIIILGLVLFAKNN